MIDCPSCDRSLWNSSLETTERAYATASSSEESDISFMLYHDDQLSTFRNIEREADGIILGNNIEEDNDDDSSSSDDED